MEIDYGYLCENLGHLSGLQVRVYRGGRQVHAYANLPFAPDPAGPVMDRLLSGGFSVCYFDILSLVFAGAIRVGKDDVTIVVGPTSQIGLDDVQLAALLREMGEARARAPELRAYYASVPHYPLESFLHILCFVNYALNDEKRSVRELIEQETSYLRRSLELSAPPREEGGMRDGTAVHNTLEMERAMLSIITAGRPEALSALFEKPPVGRVGKIAHSEMRQHKNTFICSATLASRAAIAGGMEAEAAFTTSDLYIQKAELLNDYTQLTLLNMEMLLGFARAVQQANCHGSRSRFMMEASRYITEHIGEKLTTAGIAAHFGQSRSHLCERFKAEAGVTLNEFVTEQKLVEAKRMLATTGQSVLQISEYLCYSSQGYFQNVFKKQVGCTPKEFREGAGLK